MRTFNFRKLGILLVLMLVGAMIIVGPASANSWAEKDGYKFRCGGTSASTTNYFGSATNLKCEEADYIGISLSIYDKYNHYVDGDGDHTTDDHAYLFNAYHSGKVDGGYVLASFDCYNPDGDYSNLKAYLHWN
ncbi:hypothetical protein Mpet_0859 [Methanolacinia petrolearia DSM 11571]|uniref:Uncharacterized protein n=1 Tax=Methanolacinia petrolearia (strain DSM 11571 / OCM 486 / SEBR 4847) TaxID=679926 RepID=E1RJB2_METP4|nr:hypothetical protein [Methanolacinia petrolearia]ADN35630.1 hypothetical protein Mpet_0859 [Methanolacinia petrolearia DSM 11571]